MSFPTILSGKAVWVALLLGGAMPGVCAEPAAIAPDDELTEVLVRAPEPRYVAPTNRDRIGRVWVPVFINEQGPYRLG